MAEEKDTFDLCDFFDVRKPFPKIYLPVRQLTCPPSPPRARAARAASPWTRRRCPRRTGGRSALSKEEWTEQQARVNRELLRQGAASVHESEASQRSVVRSARTWTW